MSCDRRRGAGRRVPRARALPACSPPLAGAVCRFLPFWCWAKKYPPPYLSHDIRAPLASLSFSFRLFIGRLKPRANHRMANTSYPAQAYTNCSSTTPFRSSNSSPFLIPMAKCHWRGAAWPRGRLPRPPERALGRLYMCSERSEGSMGP